MLKIQLYINDTKCDMFEDVSVTIKDSIRKAQDVGTLFTAYTRQFRLPASKTNNIIFKHFYSFKILSGGFDGRKKHPAVIKLNGADYQKGYIKLNEVQLKDNKADAYVVQFFGELTTLKDQFGEDTLEDLDYLSRYNHEFDIDTVRGGFETSLKYNETTEVMDIAADTTGEIVYPLITHTKGLKYNTTNGLYDLTETGTPTANDRLDYPDLKPAIRVTKVLEAIEDKYNVMFAGDFIENETFTDLFLWCHKNKGGIVTDDPDTNVTVYEGVIEDMTLDSFTGAIDDPSPVYNSTLGDPQVYNQFPADGQPSGSDWDKYIDYGGNYIFVDGALQRDILTYTAGFFGLNYTYYTFDVTITPSGAFTADYNFHLFSATSNVSIIFQTGLNGASGTLSGTIQEAQNVVRLHDIQFRVASNTLAEFDIQIDITAFRRATNSNGERQRSWSYSQTVTNAELITEARIPFNMPKIKVIDFIRGLLKMFNMVAYAQKESLASTNYQIVLMTLDDYYQSGSIWDITPYVDIESTTVERVTPYKNIEFKYEEASTFLVKNANEISRFEFGNLTYTPSEYGAGGTEFLFDGGDYTVELPFEKILYERLKDTDDDSNSEIMYGWFVNDFSENTPEPELGKPLLFYLRNRSCATDTIEWQDATSSTVYNAAQNVNTDETQTLHFNAEIDEYDLEVNENSLFKNYYQTYIAALYNVNARRFKISAYLTPEFIFNYSLNDKVVIAGTAFNIQEISINLLDGRATLDLLKITGELDAYEITKKGSYALSGYVEDGYWDQAYEQKYS